MNREVPSIERLLHVLKSTEITWKNCVIVRIYLIQVTEYESKTLFDNDVIWDVLSLTGFLLSIQTSKLVRTIQLITFSLHLIEDSGMLRYLTVTHQIRDKGENEHRLRRQEQNTTNMYFQSTHKSIFMLIFPSSQRFPVAIRTPFTNQATSNMIS